MTEQSAGRSQDASDPSSTAGRRKDTPDPSSAAGWGLSLLWVLVCAAGWAVGARLVAAAGPSADLIAAGYARVAAGAILAGALQWLVLRRHLDGAAWWIPASALAVAAAGVVVFAGGAVVGADAGWVAGAGLSGTLLGTVQWLVLRRQLDGAAWWVPASTVGWVVGGPVGGALGWGALGAVYGAVTAPVLAWLLRRR